MHWPRRSIHDSLIGSWLGSTNRYRLRKALVISVCLILLDSVGEKLPLCKSSVDTEFTYGSELAQLANIV